MLHGPLLVFVAHNAADQKPVPVQIEDDTVDLLGLTKYMCLP